MLNTQKLLYVLPDLAYIAELLPDKKPYTFAIQSFKQVNGEFLNETEFIPENIVKLINKLEEGEEYFLVLPDFLFTNTIISVKETSDSKIKDKLTNETLPSLGLKEETHLIETVVLNELKGTTRVQLSAIEKSILSVFKVAIAEKDIKITGAAPLSWTVKSLVSLEPSISVLQLGTKLYTAQHYIGVDQTTTANIDQPDNIIETIKTLKGAEPSIQTVYVCSNSLVEEKLKDSLSKILPIQQMATKDTNEKIPSYVSQIIIASMRTLAIPDYSVPTFKLAKPTPEEKAQYAAILTAAGVETTEEDENEISADLPKPQISPVPEVDKDEELEKEEKTAIAIDTETEDEKSDDEDEESDSILNTVPSVVSSIASTSAGVATAAAATTGIIPATASALLPTPPVVVGESLNTEKPEDLDLETKPVESKIVEKIGTSELSDVEMPTKKDLEPAKDGETPISSSVPPVIVAASQVDTSPAKPLGNTIPTAENSEDIDLKQFAQNGETAVESRSTPKSVIKNKSGAQHMMKMILITTGVFILTVAIGIGVGLAILKYSGNKDSSETPVVEVEQPTPTPIATPIPTPEATTSAEIDTKATIMVVNATTKAGYAGQIQTKLKDGTFENVTTGNAKGDYDDKGNFVYMKKENAALLAAMEKATELELTATDSAKVEDTTGKYDAVLVLAE